ncbi:MAG: hypothetical protein ACQERZ_08205 [Fusobacteriota bacterium]
MKELIRKKISQIKNKGERQLLKTIGAEVLEEMIEYQEEEIEKLENRIFNDFKTNNSGYTIYTTVVSNGGLVEVEDELFPIDPNDLDRSDYDIEEIINAINKKRKIKIDRVFLDLKYDKIKKLIASKKIFNGKLVTEAKEYDIKIRLGKVNDYIMKEKSLYKAFLKNSITWTTINNPYIRKFADVFIIEVEGLEEEIEEIKEITYNLDEFEEKKKQNMIPVWNIERITKKCSGFPEPAIDKINYKHIINFNKVEQKSGYVISNENKQILDIYQGEKKIEIISPNGNTISWDVLKIDQKSQKEMDLEFPILSNKRKATFINRMRSMGNTTPRTKGEIARIINSFKEIKGFQLKDVELTKKGEKEGITFDFNDFIEDEIHIQRSRDCLILSFSTTEKPDLQNDRLSFIVSEIQLYFPEYNCKGVIV